MSKKISVVRLHSSLDQRLSEFADRDGAELPDTFEKAVDLSLLNNVDDCKVVIATMVRIFQAKGLPELVISPHDFENCKKAKLVEEIYWRKGDQSDIRRVYRTVMPGDEGDLMPVIEKADVEQNG